MPKRVPVHVYAYTKRAVLRGRPRGIHLNAHRKKSSNIFNLKYFLDYLSKFVEFKDEMGYDIYETDIKEIDI